MSVLSSFNKAIKAMAEDGQLDMTKQAPAVEAARKLAGMMDEPSWPMVNGKLDNVSPGVFLKYCTALGIVAKEAPATAVKASPEAKLTAFRNASKFAKAANG